MECQLVSSDWGLFYNKQELYCRMQRRRSTLGSRRRPVGHEVPIRLSCRDEFHSEQEQRRSQRLQYLCGPLSVQWMCQTHHPVRHQKGHLSVWQILEPASLYRFQETAANGWSRIESIYTKKETNCHQFQDWLIVIKSFIQWLAISEPDCDYCCWVELPFQVLLSSSDSSGLMSERRAMFPGLP